MLRRAKRLTKEKGKSKEAEEAKQENARKREIDAVKLKAIKLRREKLKLEEKAALRASLKEFEGAKSSQKEKRVYVEEDESIDRL
ncbi:hypothetical protein AgCh_021628 [Apium graveolens]